MIPGAEARDTHNLTNWIEEDQAESISFATGIGAAEVTAMTLVGHPHAHISIDPHSRQVGTCWGRITRQQFCPKCLKENGGRWMLNWRLPWMFACPRHLCLLADCCPGCARAQDLVSGWWIAESVPDPLLCSELVTADGFGVRCRTPLVLAATLRTLKTSQLLHRQGQLLGLLREPETTMGIYRQRPVSASQLMVDTRALALRLLNNAPAHHLLEMIGVRAATAAGKQWREHLDRAGARGDLPVDQWFNSSAPAVVRAIGITAALSVMDSPSLEDAASKLAKYPCTKRQRISTEHVRQGQRPSLQLCAVELLSRSASFTIFDDLRYRRYSSLPQRPPGRHRATDSVLNQIPTQLWLSWSLRLVRGQRRLWRPIRQALSVMLASVGSKETEPRIQRALHFPQPFTTIHYIAGQLRAMDEWPAVAEALIALNDYLRSQPPTINYKRRREISYCGLLPAKEWSALLPLADAGRIGGKIGAAARAWLYERISGMHWRTAPFAGTVPDHREAHDRFLVILSNDLRDELDCRAEHFLAKRGIHGEPVVWEPPPEVLSDGGLPGYRLQNAPEQALERIRGGQMTIDEAVTEIRVEREVIRYWLQAVPADLRAPGHKPKFRRAKAVLDKPTLERLYVHEQRSFVEIAQQHGINRPDIISELADHYGIPRRRLTPIDIDPEWIRHQHVDCGRTFGEIAHDAGVSPWSVLNIAHRHEIPITNYWRRQPDPAAMEAIHELPSAAILLSAMVDNWSWIRLTRFAAASQYMNLGQAAIDLGVEPDTLRRQIARLERDFNKCMIYRPSSPRDAMQLSEFGEAVLREVRVVQRKMAMHEGDQSLRISLPSANVAGPGGHSGAALNIPARPARTPHTDASDKPLPGPTNTNLTTWA